MKHVPGRRERKKLEAMRHIQRTALDLFDAQGYQQVTIERIAAEADVSPSSVYRYFGTKEQLVLYDEYDPMLFEAFERELVDQDVMTALQNALSSSLRDLIREEQEVIRRRMRYTMEEPAVRAEMLRQTDEMEVALRDILARHTRWESADLEVQVVTAAVVAAFVRALSYWHDTGYRESLDEVIDRTFARLKNGLSLAADPEPDPN
ncbi:TetR/AcrR family transcriptional regulator [Phytoactinopolyspora mesophila]|nr:TetR/AcrR family transcriptional regulator [Phytoactinopolyspora mesophila]